MGLGRLRHLQNVRQKELDPLPEQVLDTGPSGCALLDPDHTSAWTRITASLVDDLIEALLGRGHLREDLFTLGGAIEATDHTHAVVVINGQDDKLGHGRSP